MQTLLVHLLILSPSMKCIILLVAWFSFCNCSGYAQDDTGLFRNFKDKITLYSLTGFNGSTITINPKFGELDKQRYLLNPPLLFGLGVAYKGLDIGFTRRLPIHLMNTSKYAKSDYYDLKFKYSWKKLHFAARFQRYKGFSLLNHQYTDPTFSVPHLGLEELTTFSTNLDVRYFFKKDFSYKSALGFSGEYLKDVLTPYLYGYTGGSSIKNPLNPLLPDYAQDSMASISKSSVVGCVEFGAVPGIAYVKRQKNLQAMMLIGWGPLIQTKWYRAENSRAFFGFNGRTDVQWSITYRQEHWFLQVLSEIQFRRVNFRQMKVQQYYYELRVYFGYVIPIKKHPKVVLDLEEKGWL